MEPFVKLSMVYFLAVGLFSLSYGLLGLNTTPTFEDLLSQAKNLNLNFGTQPTQNSICDYVIVGAGAAGCALANRLSANPNTTVCLLESGGPETIIHKMPIFTIALQVTPSNYGYKTVPQKYSCNAMNDRSCGIPQGRSLGGSSSLSYMIYDRGDPQSFDDWAAAGNEGWSYKDVEKYFLRSENASLRDYPNSPYHGSDGPVSVEDVQFTTEIADAFIQACNDGGLENIDYNDPNTSEGCSKYQATTRKGRRHSAFEAYITPIQNDRPNLRVFPFCLVTKVLIDRSTKTAYGVNFEHLGNKFTMNATKEVILSAGPFHSPQLLIVSGIGPSDMLEKIGVPKIMNLPVGENLCDHPSFIGPIWTISPETRQTIFVDRISPIDIVRFYAGDSSTIVSEISGNEAAAFVKSKYAKESGGHPDIEIIMAAATVTVDYGTIFRSSINMRIDAYNKYFKQLEGKEHWGCLILPRRPKSKGRLWVESCDVKVPPKIDPNYYSNEEDMPVVLDGIKEAMRIASLPGMQAINATLVTTKVPGCEEFKFGIDEYWYCATRAFIVPLNLHKGTCKMGPASDNTTVVDSNLRVHGITSLRVVDTSVIPVCVAGHTDAHAYMIGEKAADIILGIA